MNEKSKTYIVLSALNLLGSEIDLCQEIDGKKLISYAIGNSEKVKTHDEFICFTNNSKIHDLLCSKKQLVKVNNEISSDLKSSDNLMPIGSDKAVFERLDLPDDVIVALISGYAPFINPSGVDDAIMKVKHGESRVVISVNECRKHPILLYVQNDVYASMEQYPLEHLWYVKGATTIDNKSGKVLQHRQDYPIVFEANNNYLIFKWKDRNILTEMIRKGIATPQIVPPELSITVQDDLDMLDVELILKKYKKGSTHGA
jgi:CMP-N-acetylneuraminic acid synthetase